MIIPMIIFEGIVLCFIVLVACVVGIANGPVGLVSLYERDVWASTFFSLPDSAPYNVSCSI